MAEIRRGFGDEAAVPERLPWLEPVEDEDYGPEEGGVGRLAVIGLGLLFLLGIAVAAVMAIRHWRGAHADIGEVIHAPAGPYKERPANPGGLRVVRNGVIAEKTGTGSDINSPLDLAALPEQPITGPGSAQGNATPAPAPVPAPARQAPVATPPAAMVVPTIAKPAPVAAAPAKPMSVAPPPAKPAPKPAVVAEPPAPAIAGEGSTIQLGAFGSEAKAKAAWKTLSSRFASLGLLTMAITPVESGDTTLYRLRASGAPSAKRLCAQLKVAGESCAVVG